MTFTFYIEDQDTDIRDLTVNRLKMGTLEILVPYETSVGVGNSFELKENTTTLLKGKIIRKRDQTILTVEKKNLTCLDNTHTLYEKYCIDYGYHEYFNKDAGWIANDLVDHYFSGILTSVNIDTTTGVTVTRIEFDGKTVGAALEELAKRASCYFYVDNDNDVHFFIAESVSSGKTIQGTDLSKIRITDESIRHINKVIVRGRHRAIQASAGSGYPEEFYQDNRIISLGEAQEVANALKAELDKDRQQTQLTLPEFLDVRPGETLVLNSPDHGFTNETLPIQKVRWVFSPTRERTVLTVGDEQPTLDSILAALARGVNWEPSVQVPSGTTFPTDPADGTIFKLTQDYGTYYGPTYYKYDSTLDDWIRIPIVMHRATQPPTGGEMVGDEWYDTTNFIKYRWNGTSWEQITSLNLADMPDFGTIEWPTDQLAIEMRPWTGNFSIIWDDKDDEPPTDWNHFKWGLKDQENVADATIKYADGTLMDINFGQNINLTPDGDWYAYWDENFITGGDYDVQWTQDYSVASGVGKGLLAVVNVRNAASESPSLMMYNTYIPAMGVGSLVAHSIYSKHISVDWLTGKYYRTGPDVRWAAGVGTQGVMFQALGIMGKNNAGVVQFFLDSGDGMGYFGAGKAIMSSAGLRLDGSLVALRDAAGAALMGNLGILTHALSDWVTLSAVGANDVLLFAPAGQEALVYGGAKATMYADTGNVQSITSAVTGGHITFSPRASLLLGLSNTGVIIPYGNIIPGAGGLDIGAVGNKFGDIWGTIKYTDLHLLDTHCPKCDELFEMDDSVKFTVIAVESLEDSQGTPYDQIRCLPIHVRCDPIKRLRRWLDALLRR